MPLLFHGHRCDATSPRSTRSPAARALGFGRAPAVRLLTGGLTALFVLALVLGCEREPSPGGKSSDPRGPAGGTATSRGGAGGAAGPWLSVPSPARPYDLILITLDTTRQDRLSCYGAMSGTTPHLDAFAQDALRFENAQSPVPVTLPAHTSILTGLWPFEHGVRNNGTFIASDTLTTLAELLRGKGYETGAILGAFPLVAQFGLNQGFDHYDDTFPAVSREREEETARRPGDEVTRLALAWLDGRTTKPFFLWAHYYDPHHPYRPAESFRGRWPLDPYTGAVATMDQAVGRLLDEARRRGRLDRAVVIIAGDHGEGLGDHVELTHTVFIYGETQHVPLLLSLPHDGPFAGDAWRGRQVSGLVSLVDLLATSWNALGFAPNELPRQSGQSLLPLASGGGEPRASVYHESLIPRLESWAAELRGLQTERWKYIRAPRPELYDLASDPGERLNLADREKGRVREMEEALARLLQGERQSTEAVLDRETIERLRSLGYLAGGLSSSGPAPTADPKEMIWVPMAVTRAQELAAESRVAEALSAVDSVLARHPETSLARQLRALYLTRLGRAGEAVAAYQKALVDCGDCPEKLKLMQGYIYALLGATRHDEALRQARSLVDAYPREPWLHLLLGEALLANGDVEGARTAVIEERKVLPHDPAPLLTLATIEKSAGRMAEAERALRDALRLRADDPDTQVQLAQLLIDTNRPADGNAILDRVLAASPLHPGANFHRAEALRRAGRKEEAILSYRTALAAQPGDPLLLHRLGNTYLDLNRLDEARGCFETAVRAGRATQGVLASYGIVSARQGRPQDAVRQWEEAIRLDPQSPMVPMLQKQIADLRGRSRD